MKRLVLFFFVVITSCSQSGQKATNAEPIVMQNRDFFDTKPELTPIPLGEQQPFMPLFSQLEELPNIDTNTLQQQLESIGDEADRISEQNFPEQLRIPQLLSRYNVFRTRVGIVRYANPSQYVDSSFINEMDDLIMAWNVFADHYIRIAMEFEQDQVSVQKKRIPTIQSVDQ